MSTVLPMFRLGPEGQIVAGSGRRIAHLRYPQMTLIKARELVMLLNGMYGVCESLVRNAGVVGESTIERAADCMTLASGKMSLKEYESGE